ncbi:MAG TPA: GGDEF domain-containing protein [Candidatus Limnocylindrales bacterium]
MSEPRQTDVGGLPEPAGWTDALTGLEGPEFWRQAVISEVARATRYKRPMTVVILDVDGMADIPPIWGPEVAHHTLRETAQCLRRMARTSDQLARIGPCRFGILLTETDEIAAINFVERIRAAGPVSVPRTADLVRFVFGWASPKSGDAPEAVVRRAEARMASDRIGQR